MERVQLSGDTLPIAEHIGSAGSFAYFTTAGDVLAYRTGTSSATNTEQMTWNDRSGKELAKIGAPVLLAPGITAIEIAPDGTRAALVLSPTVSPDLWLIEFGRNIVTRFTATDGAEIGPIWSADGRRLAYRSSATANSFTFDIFSKDVDATRDAAPIMPQPTPGIPSDWSPDGRVILFTRGVDQNNSDIYALSIERKVAAPLLHTSFFESTARLSPDGRWMAYVSNESGANEIYVRPFTVSSDGTPSVGAAWRVSTSSGVVPRWRGDGKELFYRTVNGDFMAADVKVTGNAIQTSLPKRLFTPNAGVHAWDVTADGQRFLLSTPLRTQAAPTADPVTVVLNWKSGMQE
jgi:Tol biopolymer transport system component